MNDTISFSQYITDDIHLHLF